MNDKKFFWILGVVIFVIAGLLAGLVLKTETRDDVPTYKDYCEVKEDCTRQGCCCLKEAVNKYYASDCNDVACPAVACESQFLGEEEIGIDCIDNHCKIIPRDLEKTYCQPADREAIGCIALYDPVCGWFDSEKVQCVKYPCAETSSNSCHACINADVLYWTKGECPV